MDDISLEATNNRTNHVKINGLRLVPPLGKLLLLGHVYSACVVTIWYKDIGKTKETNGFNRGNKLNTSAQSTRIDRIFFDNGEAVCRVTNKRQSVCRQR